jgi:DnaJ-class molecular chaperone
MWSAMRVRDYYSILGFPASERVSALQAAYTDFVRSLSARPAPFSTRSDLDSVLQAFAVLLDSSQRKLYQEQLRRHADLGTTEPSAELLKAVDEPASILQDRDAAYPSFDEIYERILRNFTSRAIPKSEHAENLAVQVAQEPFTRSTVQIGIPTYPVCPVCRGGQAAWPFGCRYCDGVGHIENARSMEVRVPPRMPSEAQSSLDVVGIRNFYLTVRFSR